ncbi:hypothetical protein [Tomitella biformata]|uniref:hypothetical protein n=1 Tax=Tomitella biformata TaxID=630403 RepID=UPI0006868716|nr:hypothetical protein [Tomitella biformata]
MGLESLSRGEQIEALRRKMAAVPARVERAEEARPMLRTLPVAQGPPASEEPERSPASVRGVLAAPPGLAALLPDGGLARGSVTSVTGSTSLLLGMLASVTADGGHAAVIGHKGLGLLAAVEMGADLSRVALVPDPGVDRVGVAAVLLDGMDLVVLDLGGLVVPPSRSRAVVARARNRGTALVVTDGDWEGAETRIDSQVGNYEGLGVGCGRLRGLELSVRARGRSFPLRSARLGLGHGEGQAMQWRGLTTAAAVPVIGRVG